MENGRFCDALPSADGIITLMQVTQTGSTSSSSTDQSKSSDSIPGNPENQPNLINKIEVIPRIKWTEFGKIEWSKYVRWDLLLIFGFILWLVLCITDSIYPGTIYMMRVQEKLAIERSRDLEESWWVKYSSYMGRLMFANLLEAYVFVLFLGIFVWVESHVRTKWLSPEKQIENDAAALVPVYCEHDFQFDDFDESNDIYEQLMYRRDVKNIEKSGQLQIHPELYWHWKLFRTMAEITTKVKRKNKRLNKLGLHKSSSKNHYLVRYNVEAKEDVSSGESYDQEIHRFIEAKRNSSTVVFEGIVENLQKNKKRYSKWIPNGERMKSRIISSSPDFQEFLMRLRKNPTPLKRLAF